MKAKNTREIPSVAQLEAELKREKHKKRYITVLKSTICTLITVAAVAVLVATLWLPVLKIYGSSMTPTILFSLKTDQLESGDVVAFYYNNKILVKRVIAKPGDWVSFDEEGTVYVNSVPLDEPYLTEKALGECDIELPYQVPDGRIFVLGDYRSTSIDSRSLVIGCVASEEIFGKIIFRIWPLERIGGI